ncbi:uncharacterized protein MONOS_111 [Monocercomonoides exilis]|uniref:uncharacterized protein n=1 Tax=Monocercomonoides exilis TaxID=2049356 RepID=UPI00355A6C8E|nr:hypothetical protein MONOS_111 [Monocercomonoides exilis]|eukprot:MONOS_111.1-p1 / transcript=MONOS_111.1 / gene=MONOS_111 / organism=Monocercomonoides_exilis_PA203 / gene_product=unspecified product / transcript_product=unspecified product / location=Mono_scaffold00002:167084-169540(-) / protein_length=819 / sequence_SO=supercontig / SO=protein_coding / is_pseudo=false
MERHSFLGAVPQLLSSIPHSSPPKISKELFEKFTVKTLEYPPSSEFSARPVLCQYNRNPFCEVPEDVLHLLPPAAQGTRKMCRIVVRDDECRSFSLLGETLLGEYTDMEDLEAFAEEGVVIEIEVMDVPSEEIDKAKRWLKEKERRDSKKAAEYINRTTNGKLKFSYFGDNSEDNTINMEKEDEEEKEEGELTSSFEDANVKNSETSSSDMPSVQDAPTFPLMQDSHKDEQDANHMHSEVEEADAWSDSYNTEDSELNTQLQSVFLKPTMPSLDSPRKDSHLLIHPPTRMEIESNQMTNSFGGITSNIGPLSTERTFNPSFTDSYQPKQNNSINQPQRDSSEAPSFLALPSSTDNLGTETCQRHSEHHIPYVKFTTQSVPLYQQMHSSFDRRSTGISHHLQDSYEQFDQRNTNSTQQQLNSASTSATNDSLFTNSHSLLTSTSSPSDFTGISNNSKKDAFSTKPFASFSSSFSNEIYQPPQIQEGSTADCKYCKRKVFVNQLASHENGCRNKMLYQNELGTSVQPSQSHREDSLENEERTIFSASSKQPLFDSDQLLTETLSTHPFANIMDDSHTQTDIQTPSTLHSTNQSSQILKFSQNDIYKDSISIPPFFIETVKSNAEQHKSIPAHFTPHSHLLQVSTLHPSITHVFAMPHPMPREISADTVEMEKEILDKWSKTILLATFGTDLVLRTCVLSPDDWESPDKTNSDTEFSSALRSSSDEADAFFVPQHIPVVPKEIAASFSFIPESSVFKNNSEGYDTPENMFGSLYSISKLSAHKQEQTIASYFDLCTSVVCSFLILFFCNLIYALFILLTIL